MSEEGTVTATQAVPEFVAESQVVEESQVEASQATEIISETQKEEQEEEKPKEEDKGTWCVKSVTEVGDGTKLIEAEVVFVDVEMARKFAMERGFKKEWNNVLPPLSEVKEKKGRVLCESCKHLEEEEEKELQAKKHERDEEEEKEDENKKQKKEEDALTAIE